MKRLLCMALSAAMLLSLTACSGAGRSPSTADSGRGDNSSSDAENTSSGNLVESEELTAFESLFKNGPIPAKDQNGLWGYINISGEYVIDPSFVQGRKFDTNGLAVVQDQDGFWGCINTAGEYVVDPAFSQIKSYSKNGLIGVQDVESGRFGLIDISGNYIVEPQLTEMSDQFCDGLLCVNDGNGWFYIDESGKFIAGQFGLAYDFSEGLALVLDFGGSCYYIDTSGNVVISGDYMGATSFYNDRAFVSTASMFGTETPYYALIDKEGHLLSDYIFDISSASYISSSSRSSARSEGGRKISWDSGLCPVKLADGSGAAYINMDGEVALPKDGPAYRSASSFSGGYALVYSGEGGNELSGFDIGYIDADGNWIYSFQYGVDSGSIASMSRFRYGHAVVNNRIIDTLGNCITELDNMSIDSVFGEEHLVVRDSSTGKYGIVDINGNMVTDFIYDEITGATYSYDGSYAVAIAQGLCGIIDNEGNWLIPAKFMSIIY